MNFSMASRQNQHCNLAGMDGMSRQIDQTTSTRRPPSQQARHIVAAQASNRTVGAILATSFFLHLTHQTFQPFQVVLGNRTAALGKESHKGGYRAAERRSHEVLYQAPKKLRIGNLGGIAVDPVDLLSGQDSPSAAVASMTVSTVVRA